MTPPPDETTQPLSTEHGAAAAASGANVFFDSATTCDECGRTGAYGFDGEALCLDCYQERGACCAESRMDP